MTTSIVAGGAGFIGSHLCDKLITMGHRVICLDDFSTGSTQNINRLMISGQFVPINCDITDNDTMDINDGDSYMCNMIAEECIDYIWNLASPASPVKYQAMPLKTMQCGSIGVFNLMNVAIDCDATFLQASTSEVYGDPLVNPQPESYFGNVNPIGERSIYDEAKRFGETIVMAANREGAKTRIARIFNTYGPYMDIDDGRVIPNFIAQALNGVPLTVYGDGNQTRSLCYVTDTVDGLIRLMMGDYDKPVNIGNPDERTVNEIASLINTATGASGDIIYKDLPEDDPKVRCPDISIASSELGWSPEVGLIDGLNRTIGYFEGFNKPTD